jgi:RNA polymerase sigma-70 factor (ECF subfamily)
MLNDFAILKKIKEGDIRTFEMIFRQYYNPLCMYASGMTGRTDISEEVVQDVFYNFWKGREQISILGSLKNYLYGAVRNHSLRYREQLKVQETHRDYVLSSGSEVEHSPQELLEYEELETIIQTVFDKLPERRKQIFRMYRAEGKKYKEIADLYAISVKTVEAEMTKVYKTLRQEIEKYYG